MFLLSIQVSKEFFHFAIQGLCEPQVLSVSYYTSDVLIWRPLIKSF